MSWESFGVVGFDLGAPPSRSNEDSQTFAYNSLSIDPRCLQCKTNS